MRFSRRRLLITGLASLSFVAGCEFQPLYGEKQGAVGPGTSILVGQILGDRTAQQLHNYLRDLISPEGLPDRPDYLLATQLSAPLAGVGSERNVVRATASFQLYELTWPQSGSKPTRKVLFSSSAKSMAFYATEKFYVEDYMILDARDRAMQELAHNIDRQVREFLFRNQ